MTGPTHNTPDTWVLLRGLTREQRHWGGFPKLLAEQLPGAHIVALDLPGNGRLCAQTSPATVPEMACARTVTPGSRRSASRNWSL